ncbi:MAG: hypothetical protein K2F81_06875, partial [Ruminococcus sp.]|nr:hypothetical protein [Ruminococcus sp.]
TKLSAATAIRKDRLEVGGHKSLLYLMKTKSGFGKKLPKPLFWSSIKRLLTPFILDLLLGRVYNI